MAAIHEEQDPMPKQQGLARRGNRYFTYFRVPKDLREVFEKEFIREALGTSDYREACERLTKERARWQFNFDQERRKRRVVNMKAEKDRRETISEREAFDLAAGQLVTLERQFRTWWENEGLKLDSNERQEVIHNVADELASYEGDSVIAPDDGSSALKDFLEEHRLEIPSDSPAYRVLRPLFRQVHAEHAARKLEALEGQSLHSVKGKDPHFREIFASTAIPEHKPSATVSDLLAKFIKSLKERDRSEATMRTYEMPFRVLREGLGKGFPLSSLDGDTFENLCDLLRQIPVNSAQRYPGLTLKQAVEAADKAGDKRRLGKRTARNYFTVFVGIFNFAVKKKMLAENPAKDNYLKDSFGKPEHKPKPQFTVKELNMLFRAPLYTGCVDDNRGYAKPGPNKPRRGRFWVPLLALFHGLRSNEACQLHIADIKEAYGIPYMAVREETDEDEQSDKRLKTSRSNRRVPIHPELLKIGFLEFVNERRKADDSPRLFPELPSGARGYYSHVFGKWFPRFVKAALGYESEATLHSQRHSFRDATRAARLPAETVALLGGWQGGNNSSDGNPALVMNDYGKGEQYFRVLSEDLAKVAFPGLDLSHLYREQGRRSIRER